MNQAELVAKLADTGGLDKAQAGQAGEGVLATICDALKAGEKVGLQELWIFEISDRAARQGRNPATGETIQIPASKSVKFRPTKSLRRSSSLRAAPLLSSICTISTGFIATL